MINALSVDVEDYFMVENFASTIPFEDWERYPLRLEESVQNLLSLFALYQVHATFFVLGWVAEKLPKTIKLISEKGHEIACHGYSHRPVYKLGKELFKEEIQKAKKILEDLLGHQVIGYRAATYSINEEALWAWDVLVENGFRYDSSYRPFLRHHWDSMPLNNFNMIQTPSGKELMEFPISVKKVFGLQLPIFGGGYFRIIPVSWVSRGIQQLNEKGRPANVYIHPWEIDPDQPKISVNPLIQFRHRVNLSKTLGKLKYLLDRFQFAPIREVLKI